MAFERIRTSGIKYMPWTIIIPLWGLTLLGMIVGFPYALPFDTEYAPGFSESAFQRIVVGMNAKMVLDTLGEPLERYPWVGDQTGVPLGEAFWYSRPTDSGNYHMRAIYVDRDGIVKKKVSRRYFD